jgi:hypothetical protein
MLAAWHISATDLATSEIMGKPITYSHIQRGNRNRKR